MGRFFNREAALVAVTLLVCAVGIGLISGLRPWVIAASSAAAVALLHWPVTIWAQMHLLELYTKRKNYTRALELAHEIKESSMTRSERDKASLDIALIHLDRGDYENAAKHLRSITTSQLRPLVKAVVEANLGYALAHLERDLDLAETLVKSGQSLAPQEPLFGYFLGLVRLKQGRYAEARDFIHGSLASEPDFELPYPGERNWALGMAIKGIGDPVAAQGEFAKAAKGTGRFAELAQKELAGAPGAAATP